MFSGHSGAVQSLALRGGFGNHSGVFDARPFDVCLLVGQVLGGGPDEAFGGIPAGSGGSVVIEVEKPPVGPVTRGAGKDCTALMEAADKSFEDATAAVAPAARSLLARLRSIDDPPDEIGIVFGVQTGGVHRLGGRAGQFHGVDDVVPPAWQW